MNVVTIREVTKTKVFIMLLLGFQQGLEDENATIASSYHDVTAYRIGTWNMWALSSAIARK